MKIINISDILRTEQRNHTCLLMAAKYNFIEYALEKTNFVGANALITFLSKSIEGNTRSISTLIVWSKLNIIVRKLYQLLIKNCKFLTKSYAEKLD